MIRFWNRNKQTIIPALLVLVLISLAACRRNEENITPEATAAATTAAVPTEQAAEPTATPSPAPTPTEEPPVPAVSVSDQALEDDGRLLIREVTAVEPGWVVVYADDSGSPGAVLGYSAVEEGQSEDLAVLIDPLAATETLHVRLHADAGESGVFDYPGPDNPVSVDSEPVEAMFVADIRATIPAITVENQEITRDGRIRIASVVSTGPGWLVLYQDDDGQPGRLMGYLPVAAGLNENLVIPINWREAGPDFLAALYLDGGEPEVFEASDIEEQVTANAVPVEVSFEVALPPDVFVLNQPVIDDTIVVERAVSHGPGWLVIYRDEDGATGNIIGFAPLEDGVNEQIEVGILTSEVSPLLYIIVHEDDGTAGDFDFPAADGPMRFQGTIPNPYSFRTDTGNYLIMLDQPLSADNTVTVTLAVVDVDAWVTIRNNSAGQAGEVIGRVWVPAGVHRNVEVEIDPSLTTITMFAVLHIDIGEPQTFDFPDGVDFPLQRNRSFIQVPFLLE
jgi:hypothetical protein